MDMKNGSCSRNILENKQWKTFFLFNQQVAEKPVYAKEFLYLAFRHFPDDLKHWILFDFIFYIHEDIFL